VITSVESLPVMILLLGGLAKATAAVAKITAATKNRAVSAFMIHKLTAICISATEIGGGRGCAKAAHTTRAQEAARMLGVSEPLS
jgi:hypothetical protein